MANDKTKDPSTGDLPTIKYAIIGYGAAAAQFLVDLVYWRVLIDGKYSPRTRFPARIDITVYSSGPKEEDGAGDAWNRDQCGPSFSKTPIHPNCPLTIVDDEERSDLSTISKLRDLYYPVDTTDNGRAMENLRLEILQKLVSNLNLTITEDPLSNINSDILSRLKESNIPATIFYAKNNQLASRSGRGRKQQSGATGLSKHSFPRYFVGQCRRAIMDKLLKDTTNYKDYLTIKVVNDAWATLEHIDNPKQPTLKVRKNHMITWTGAEYPSFDKVIIFSGTRRDSPINDVVISAAYTGPPTYGTSDRPGIHDYLTSRDCIGKSVGKTIGFAGAQLSFVDNVSIVSTVRGFLKQGRNARTYQIDSAMIKNFRKHLVVFSREDTGSFKPLLDYSMAWSPEISPEGNGDPVGSYLNTEHLLALRTQAGYEWIEVVETIWKAMISYKMGIHPTMYPRYTRMEDEWKDYFQQCRDSRDKKPTFCGLERILVNALFHGYGAEPDIADAESRMNLSFPDIFVSGERMFAALYAHVSSSTCIDRFGSNTKAIKTLTSWHRTYSSCPIEICQPIYDLAVRGVITHVKADVTEARLENNRFVFKSNQDIKVDALFAPNPFGVGLDAAVSPIANRLETTHGVPIWRTNGQLVEKGLSNDQESRINVWDRGNNRGIGLPYRKSGGEAIIRPWIGTNALSTAHELGSSLAISLLADDVYAARGVEEPFRKLHFESKSTDKDKYVEQMKKLESSFDEVMEHYHYLKAIENQFNPEGWRKLYESGTSLDGRSKAIKELIKTDPSELAVYNAHLKYLKEGPSIKRQAMDYTEWWAPFTDPKIEQAWEVLDQAISEGVGEQ